MRAETKAASAAERPEKATSSVPPWLDPVGTGRLRLRRKASASGITVWAPGARATLVVPAPVAPREVAGVYVSSAVAAVVPRFASVSSVVYRELPTPATSRTIGTSFVAVAPVAEAVPDVTTARSKRDRASRILTVRLRMS